MAKQKIMNIDQHNTHVLKKLLRQNGGQCAIGKAPLYYSDDRIVRSAAAKIDGMQVRGRDFSMKLTLESQQG